MSRCDLLRPRLSPFLDGDLGGPDFKEISEHIGSCAACSRELSARRALSTLLKGLPRRPLPAGFQARLEARRASRAGPNAGRRGAWAASLALAGVAAIVLIRRPQPPAPTAPPQAPLAPEPRPAPREGDLDALRPRTEAAAKRGQAPAPSVPRGETGSPEDLIVLPRERQDEFLPPQPQARLGAADQRAQMRAYLRQLAMIRESLAPPHKDLVPINGKTARLLASAPPAAGPLTADGASAWRGQYGGANEAGTRTITDRTAWQETWTRLSTLPLPMVDFSRLQLVAVFLGHRPTGGYAVEILEVSSTESALIVRWRESGPPAGTTPPEGATSPYGVKAVPRTDLPSKFEKLP